MKFLLDENVSPRIAESANAYGRPESDEFTHIEELQAAGTPDAEIPALALAHGYDCLITVNVRDFGAKKFLYEALLANGLHVVVLRPLKTKFTSDQQLAMLLKNYRQIVSKIQDAGLDRVLMSANWSEVRVRTIAELVEEFDRGNKLP